MEAHRYQDHHLLLRQRVMKQSLKLLINSRKNRNEEPKAKILATSPAQEIKFLQVLLVT